MQSRSKSLKGIVDNILQVKVIGPCYAPLDVATVVKDVLFLFSVLLLCLYYLIVQHFNPWSFVQARNKTKMLILLHA